VATGTAGRLGPLPVDEVDDGDRFRGQGPLAGIAAALRRSPHPVVAVLAVDLTDASPTLVRWLRTRWTAGDVALLPADATGRPQPLHGLIGTVLAAPIEAALATGERRVLRVLEGAGARTIAPPPELGDGWARNRNTPESVPE
jgi:molybdopterin-guanine dinucleotide biosynthesis protein A